MHATSAPNPPDDAETAGHAHFMVVDGRLLYVAIAVVALAVILLTRGRLGQPEIR